MYIYIVIDVEYFWNKMCKICCFFILQSFTSPNADALSMQENPISCRLAFWQSQISLKLKAHSCLLSWYQLTGFENSGPPKHKNRSFLPRF